ncbi:unnamed protein product, partial [Mesorhabditis belari]|uniref:Oxidoreductase-like domain-containing protein n=1 Tax=Mesorhabditis belari TaxID=2138241 RepID=A0AAF3FFL1_9BILA
MLLIRNALRCLANRGSISAGSTSAGSTPIIHVGTDVIRVSTSKIAPRTDIDDELGNRPRPPVDGECCGQGCQKCVWIEYGNDLIDYYQSHPDKDAISRIESEIKDPVVRAFVMAELKPRVS